MNEKVKSFLEKNEIDLIREKPLFKEKVDAKVYIENLIKIHDILKAEENTIKFKLPSEIWKLVQIFKLWNNRVSRIENGNELINLITDSAQNSIKSIEKIDYKALILRAMNNKEICVRKIYLDLNSKNSKISILESEKIAFGMIEDDYYEYLKKLKGEKEVILDELIDFILEKERLKEESYVYIKALLGYPHNSMKYLQNSYLKTKEISYGKLSELAKKDFLI